MCAFFVGLCVGCDGLVFDVYGEVVGGEGDAGGLAYVG